MLFLNAKRAVCATREGWHTGGGGISEVLSHGGMGTVKSIVKGIWEFCSYVFVPQRREKDYYNL